MSSPVCPWWHAYTFDNFLRRIFRKPEIILAPYVKRGMTVVDIGCGMGIFSIGMARMVGDDGSVIAVDVQQKMLDVLLKRARRAGVADRIRAHLCEPGKLSIQTKVDFALAFWMMHEVEDQAALARQVRDILTEEAKFLIVEPTIHVSKADFEQTMEAVAEAGLVRCGEPRVRLSRSAVFERSRA